MKYMKIHNELFPYDDPKYGDTHPSITGQHLFYNMLPTELPANYRQKTIGLIDVQVWAEDKFLKDNPQYDELTWYGTRRAGFYKGVRLQAKKTLYWMLNKQPASLTLFCSQITGLSNETTDPYSIYGLTQLCMQLGVTIQLVIPETGYACLVEPVCNKKRMDIFTKDFTCERYYKLYLEDKLPDELLPQITEIKAKYDRLLEHRQTIQTEIWANINLRLQDYRDEWKCQNIYTMPGRQTFVIQAQVSELLLAYKKDFKLTDKQALTIEDLKNPALYSKILYTVSHYAAPFGIDIKLSEKIPDVGTYTPKHWLRDDRNTITDSVLLKRAFKQQQNMQIAPLNELLQAYMQIDYYLNLPDFTEFLAEGYTVCICHEILNKHDAYCPACEEPNPDYEPQTQPYDTTEDCARKNWLEYQG